MSFDNNSFEIIKNLIHKNLGVSVVSISHIGKGASGSVYRVNCAGNPKTIAVKISEHPELMLQEYEMLAFLKERTLSKIPKTYFFDKAQGIAVIAMEFINGTSGDDEDIKKMPNQEYLAESIINNLLSIQQAHNDKFGPYNNAVYDTWQDYYKKFANEIYAFATSKHSAHQLGDVVMSAVEISYANFDKFFSEETPLPTLIHGDYWVSNFIVDKNSMELLSVVDPFNVMWADPEYELFALTVGYGKELHLYELYKSKVKVSKYCDVKLEIYALYSELLWYKKLGSISHEYLAERATKLIEETKNKGICLNNS